MKYFEVGDDLTIDGRWFLKGPIAPSGLEVDPRRFTRAEPFSLKEPLRIPIRHEGKLLDFTFADFDMPVVSPEVGKMFSGLCGKDIQRIPVSVSETAGNFEILNILCKRPCLDESRSESITRWTQSDGRPEKLGKPRMVIGLRIDPSRVSSSHAFRIDGWEIALVVSEKLKALLEEHMVTGITFREVG